MWSRGWQSSERFIYSNAEEDGNPPTHVLNKTRPMKKISIIGPYLSNFSFARVNRGLAIAMSALKKDFSIRVAQDENKIDRKINQNDLAKHPELKDLYDLSPQESDIVIYNDFPKDIYTLHGLKDLQGKIKIGYWAWEESVFPKMCVDEINKNLHGVAVISSFVGEILRKNGVKIPIQPINIGIDNAMIVEPKSKFDVGSNKSFKFLHISSAKARKGIDVLIESFCKEFTINDDAVLVIKSFPGPDNKVNELIAKFRTENSPEIIHIFESEFTDQQMVDLIHSCNCAVYPSRAEGFGLPAAEAMLHGLPLIVTGYSGFTDFSNHDNSYVLNYQIEDTIKSEFANPGAKWAEPDSKQLQAFMRLQYEIFRFNNGKFDDKSKQLISNLGFMPIEVEAEMQKDKLENAFNSAKFLTWERAAEEMFDFIEQVESFATLKEKKAGVISFFNNKDGLAKYTKDLYSPVECSFKDFFYISNTDIADRTEEDESNVIRLWESGTNDFGKVFDFIKSEQLDLIHIQYHSGINFSFSSLGKLITDLKALNIKVFVTLHSVKGKNFNIVDEVVELNLADRVFIHSKDDFKIAASKLDNISYFSHPKNTYHKRDNSVLKKKLDLGKNFPIVLTHGMLNADKSNLEAVIMSVKELKNDYPDILHLGLNTLVPNNINAESEYSRLTQLVKNEGLENNVLFVVDFLSDEMVLLLIQASDVIIAPYNEVGESASAAVAKFLFSGSPVIVTDIKMFDDLNNEVIKIDYPEKDLIYGAIRKCIGNENKNSIRELVKKAEKFVLENSFEVKSRDLLKVYASNYLN